jgi:hypothetical protein
MTHRRRMAAVLISLLSVFLSPQTTSCTFPEGYFFQVMNLKGQVIGPSRSIWQSIRWWRQTVPLPNVKLILYVYCSPCILSNQTQVKSAVTTADGRFDFGSVKPGHYTLAITDDYSQHSDRFDVEIKGLPDPKQFEIINISPATPDCKGGHKFIVRID